MYAHELATESVGGSAFQHIVENTGWLDQTSLQRLRVAPKLGWLVTTGTDGIDGLVGFSVEVVDEIDQLLPPQTIAEVQERWKNLEVGWLNTDMTAKGLGSKMANTPLALQPHTIRGPVIAVRSVPLRPTSDIYMRDESNTALGRLWQLARHGGLLAISVLADKMTRSTYGTEQAIRYMEKEYKEATLVYMPAPAIWQIQQHQAGVVHAVPPGQANPMTRIGSYSVSAMRSD